MIALPPDVHRAVHEEIARGERAHSAMLIDLDRGGSPAELRALLLAMASSYERAAQRIPQEVERG